MAAVFFEATFFATGFFAGTFFTGAFFAARLRFGGKKGEVLDVAAGDVAVRPAGTGHQKLSASADFLVVGAYPPDGTYDLCRGGAADHAKALATIPNVPVPNTDPVFGPDGPLVKLWAG